MDTIYRGITTLMVSAATGENRQLPEDFSLEQAMPIIRKQNLVPLAFQGALNCGISPKDPVMTKLMQVYIKHVVHSEKQMRAVRQLFAAFEENGIDYLPLKGCRMKDLYPKPELRSMGDADILIRVEQYSSVEPLMLSMGFTMYQESSYDYVWRREDLTVELHKNLVPPRNRVYHQYFGDGWSRAVQKTRFQYDFSPEDTFIFQFAHMAKHYQRSGIGSRHILDLYIYLRANPNINEAYMEVELEKMQLLTFYRNVRRMLRVWFEDETPDAVTEYMTEYIFSGGSWGTLESRMSTEAVLRSQKKGGIRNSRIRTLIRLIFPLKKTLEARYPLLRKAPWMLPAVWVARWIRVLLFRSWNIRRKMSMALDMTDDKVLQRKQALNYVGLDLEGSTE